MNKKILVCYATGTGSTGEVAEFIAQTLRGANVTVDVYAVEDVQSLAVYDAVVLGSSIRFGKWLPEAVLFLDDSAEILSQRPVALFTTCITIVSGTEHARRNGLAYWAPILSRIPSVRPVGLGLFAGALNPAFGLLDEYRRAPYGDYRNWDEIGAWSREIRNRLLEEPSRVKPMVLRNTILSYTDLSGSDMSKFDFQESAFIEAAMREANLRKANLRKAKLESADLRDADFRQANLGWANLANANCQDANFTDATMMGASFEKADLQNATLHRAVLNGATLQDAQLQGANLRRVDLNWANLRGANLQRADLSDAHLGWADLRDADLTDAILTRTRYNDETQWPEGFDVGMKGCISFEYLVD